MLVPALLLLVGWDLLVNDPSHALAWRLLHDPRLGALSATLPLLIPEAGSLDRDPLALCLGALACLLACAYLGAALAGAGTRARACLVAAAAALLVLLPTAVFVAVGFTAERPFGQDGGVVQLPLALDKILAGESPYGADYSRSVLGRQSRVSEFWAPYGGNPILRHHAYLPGTHLIVMPFYLACRGLLGAFDTRLVTTLALLLTALLAVRLVDTVPARLTAAALVAVNPLVYWHQVFGANDVLFVVSVLGSVLLARGRRPLAAGALLGLACATKQLAWPFAPFLLAQLSGARSLRELARSDALKRLLRPAAAALLVFVVVVAPIAARDLRAFYGDIVAYNVGLPGGDNYPLGGTPGFGFANFVIYFGGVSSLRDVFPFTIFYALLLPLGLALLREQLRDGRAETALVAGSVALVASLYFSRVVHPNYLVAAAMLLPLGVLATRRAADVALVPLLLLGLAAGIVERGCFRLVWEQAAAAGWPSRLSGLPGLLAPRAGPGLTLDPLGLLFSGLAAGLGVCYLAAAVLRARAAWRGALAAAALALAVALPCGVVLAIGQATGLKRAQDAWAIQVPADAARLARGRSPYRDPSRAPLGRGAWSDSFRLEPPPFLAPDAPLVPPGAALLALPLRPLRIDDGRLLSLLGLVVSALALLAWAPRDSRPLALGLLLATPFAVGSVFGSAAVPALAPLLAAALLAARGRPLGAGLLAGVACGCSHELLLAAPFAVLAALEGRGLRRCLLGAGLGYGVMLLPALLLDPAAYLARALEVPTIGPGVGLANLLFWRDLGQLVTVHALFALLPVAVTMLWLFALGRARQGGPAPLLAAGGFALLGLVTARNATPASLAVPLVLIGMAGVAGRDGEA